MRVNSILGCPSFSLYSSRAYVFSMAPLTDRLRIPLRFYFLFLSTFHVCIKISKRSEHSTKK